MDWVSVKKGQKAKSGGINVLKAQSLPKTLGFLILG